MSWDVYLIKTATNAENSPEEIEDTVPIGTKSAIHDWLRQNYPETDFTDENWPVVFADDFSVEFMLDKEEQQGEITLAIQGDQAPYDLIEGMCRSFGCRAVDTGTGEFLDTQETSSFEQWKDFRDEVQAEYNEPKGWSFRGIIASLRGWITGK